MIENTKTPVTQLFSSIVRFGQKSCRGWPPFRKELLIRLPYDFFVLCLFVITVISNFDFEGGTLVLIASVPGHCLPFTF